VAGNRGTRRLTAEAPALRRLDELGESLQPAAANPSPLPRDPSPPEPLDASTRDLEKRQAAWFIEREKFERRRAMTNEAR
jgi:hypothetical protein